jgi:hypothetical protein
MPTLRISLAKALVIVALAAVLLSFLIVPFTRQMEWVRLFRQMETSLNVLKPAQPNSIGPGTWDCAHRWVVTAYCNICFSPQHTATAEMYRLRDDLGEKLNDRIDLETLKWIWIRLGETGPHGKRYTERFEPSFRDCLPPGTW